MAEMIYTHIEPKKKYSGFYHNQNTWDKTDEYKKLAADIKANGFKFPILGYCTDGVWSETKCGHQRIAIALDLKINNIPAILYSIHRKTGFKGTPITGIDAIVKICGESIKSEPVYQSVVGAIKNIRARNNYPPDPLKN